MTQKSNDDEISDIGMTAEQLAAYEHGWGAMIMPSSRGWKLYYFSVPDFDEEPGTVFPDFDAAMDALYEILPAANSQEQKEKARRDLERLSQQTGRGSLDA